MHAKGKYALALARAGFRVFPVSVDDPAKTASKIKRPAIPGWQKRATTNPEKIEYWWRHTDWNIGVATGPGGNVVVLDYDMKPGQDGKKSLWAHETFYNLPLSYRVKLLAAACMFICACPPASSSKIA